MVEEARPEEGVLEVESSWLELVVRYCLKRMWLLKEGNKEWAGLGVLVQRLRLMKVRFGTETEEW